MEGQERKEKDEKRGWLMLRWNKAADWLRLASGLEPMERRRPSIGHHLCAVTVSVFLDFSVS